MFDYSKLPRHMQRGMQEYLEQRVMPGSFMYNILANDFMGACRKADDINQECLFAYAQFLYSEAPVGSYGSAANVEAWLNPAPAESKP